MGLRALEGPFWVKHLRRKPLEKALEGDGSVEHTFEESYSGYKLLGQSLGKALWEYIIGSPRDTIWRTRNGGHPRGTRLRNPKRGPPLEETTWGPFLGETHW